MIQVDRPRSGETDAAGSLLSVLMYPATWSGLWAVAMVAAVPAMLGLCTRHTHLATMFFTRVGIAILLFTAVYLAWFVPECIRDSARGGERAPSVILSGVNRFIMISRAACALAVVAVFVFPLVWYVFEDRLTFVVSVNLPDERRNVAIVCLLAAWAVVYTPMGLLSMAMHASPDAMNPRFLTSSICRVFTPYLRLAAGIAAYVALAWVLLDRLYSLTSSIPPRACGAGVCAYGMLVIAHMLGRFYRRHEEQLNWGV
ncbi:MAG TPA: hypothetical protein PK373_10050 [Sedimentisphaerales bacterium]|nr:hypothetical protein [Phycisphaerae bacterium]HON93415.1 hypothetical protein [Sedimentisphaerales bacterium]HQG49418.1 hypothetical protein [Sedimentisphaerales bacterium]HQI27206.1 hypothetical protein [Sedimentisphaerales bacterium]